MFTEVIISWIYGQSKRLQLHKCGRSWLRSFASAAKDGESKDDSSESKSWGPESEEKIKNPPVEPKLFWGQPIPEMYRGDHLPDPVRNTEREYFQAHANPDLKGPFDSKYYTKRHGITHEVYSWLHWDVNINDVDELRFRNRKFEFEELKKDQRFIEDRMKAVGPELGAAHFVIARGGAVKFFGKEAWFVKDVNNRYAIPRTHVENLYIEAMDVSNMPLTYVAFDNLEYLSRLRYLRMRNCPFIDDWCLSSLQRLSHCLEFLDISDCPNITDNGLSSLQSLHNLQCLRVSSLTNVRHLGLLTLLLEEKLPNLAILGITEDDLKPPSWQHRGERRLVKALLGFLDEDKEEEEARKLEILPEADDDDFNNIMKRKGRRVD